MTQIDASVHSNPTLSAAQNRAHNTDFNFSMQSYLYEREPDGYVYIFNISTQAFDVFRPPILKALKITGKQKGQEYAKCARFPKPLLVPQGSIDTNEITTQLMDTRRFVMDIINPDNISLDQDAIISNPTNVGNDLGKKGVFWSENEVPTEKELKAAKDRMERYYNTLLEKAKAVEASQPGALPDTITPEHHAAADYYGIETSWHQRRSEPTDCPNCGERIKKGIAFHRNSDGLMCVIDWRRAVASGAVTRSFAYEATEDPQFAPRVATVAPAVSAPAAPAAVKHQ